MCTPAIRAFKKNFPDCELEFLTEYPDVLRGNPHLGTVIHVEPSKQFNPRYQYRLIRGLREKRYHIVVDFLANPRSAYYSFLTGAKTRLSYGYGHRRWAYNLSPSRPGIPVYAALDRLNLLKAIDVVGGDAALEFHPSRSDREEAAEVLKERDRGKFVTVSPVSRREYRRWPLRNFAELCRRLKSELNFEIVIIVGPGEEMFGEELKALLETESPLLLKIDRLGLLGAVFESAALHVGNDNGPKHIAVACGVPTFAIFGPDNPVSWTHPDSGRHSFISSRDVDPGCRREDHRCGPECILKISVEDAWSKLSFFVSRLQSPAHTGERG